MKNFVIALASLLLVIAPKTYNDYTEYCNCVEKLEIEVVSYNAKHLQQLHEASIEAERSSPNVTAKKVGTKTPVSIILKVEPDPWGRSYSSLTGWSIGTLNEQCKTQNWILKLFRVENHF